MNYRYHLTFLFTCTLLVLLSACDSQTPMVATPATTTTTVIPPTNTSCPQPGTSRPAVLSSMAAGSNPALVTIDDQNQVHLYDTKKQSQSIIMKLPRINEVPQLSLDSQLTMPQLSADGQWLLFLAPHARQQELRVVRLDGKGVQTLYCPPKSTSIFDPRWSPDQKRVAISEYTSHDNTVATAVIKLLDLTTGTVTLAVQPRTEKRSTENGTFEQTYIPRLAKWLDKTHLYVQSQGPIGTESLRKDLYLLDVTKKLPQKLDTLPKLATGDDPFFDFANSRDGSQLYVSHCTGELSLPIVPQGPSRITVQPALGGPASVLLQTQMAVISVSVVSPSTILFVVNRGMFPTEHDQKVLAYNGLWKMNKDGSGLTRLMQTGEDHSMDVVPDIAHSSNLYAISHYDGKQQTLSFGAATQNRLTTLARFAINSTINSDHTGGQMIVGWTTTR